MARSKAKHRKQTEARALQSSSPQSSQNAPASKNALLWGGALASFLLLIFIYIAFPGGTSENALKNDRLTENEPTKIPTSPPQVSSEASPKRAAPVFELPSKPRTIDTKAEQDRLLANVEKLVAEYPQSADAMHIAAITYSELLQTEKAAAYFEKSLAINRHSPQVLVDYASLLLQTGKQQAAVDLLTSASDSARSAAVIDSLGNAYMQLGELDKAAETLSAGAKSMPNDSSIRLRLAQVQLQLQQFEEAEKNARVAIDLGRTNNAAYTALSSALIRLGRRDEALEIRSKTTSVNPQAEANDEQYKQSFQQFAAHTYGMLGGVYQANQKFEAAEAMLLDSVSLDPTAATSLVALGDLFFKQQRIDPALQVYKRLVEVQPDNIFNYNNLASLSLSTGNVPLAEDALRRAVKADATGNATLRLADFLLRLGNASEAATQAEAAVKQLGNADAYLVWVSALKADGKMAAALSALIKARETNPGDERLKNIQL